MEGAGGDVVADADAAVLHDRHSRHRGAAATVEIGGAVDAENHLAAAVAIHTDSAIAHGANHIAGDTQIVLDLQEPAVVQQDGAGDVEGGFGVIVPMPTLPTVFINRRWAAAEG